MLLILTMGLLMLSNLGTVNVNESNRGMVKINDDNLGLLMLNDGNVYC